MTTISNQEKRIIANNAMNTLINRVGFTEYIETVMRGAPIIFSSEQELEKWVKKIYEAVCIYGFLKDSAFENFLCMAEDEIYSFEGYVGLKALRAEHGLTLQALAAKTGLCSSQLRKIEHGDILFEDISVKSATQIAKALGISLDTLVDELM